MVHPTLHKGIVTSPFGWRSLGWHGGEDYGGLPIGTPVYASYGGKVTAGNSGCGTGFLGDNCGNGGGNWLEITTNSNLKTRYMHLNSLAVSIGSNVSEGQVIGYLGNSGSSTAAHLHYELWINGQQVDPAPYLKNASATPRGVGNKWLGLLLGGIIIYVLSE